MAGFADTVPRSFTRVGERAAMLLQPGRYHACHTCGTPRWIPDDAVPTSRLRCWMSPCVVGPARLEVRCPEQAPPSVWRTSAEVPPGRAEARAKAVHDAALALAPTGNNWPGNLWGSVRDEASRRVPAAETRRLHRNYSVRTDLPPMHR
eukprot:5809746-Alexandrium_andersonii.AAC.1